MTYASPDINTINSSFLITYSVFNHTYLYVSKSERSLTPTIVVCSLIAVLQTFYAVLEMLFGLNYFSHYIVTVMVEVVIICVLVGIDKELMRLAEKLAFLQQPSRTYKFYALFLCLSLFLVAVAMGAGLGDAFSTCFGYVQNAVEQITTHCKKDLQS